MTANLLYSVNTIHTIGHSNRTAAEFTALLREYGIARLVDVRRWPVSTRHPHFSWEPLARFLSKADISYAHEADLGGHRSPREASPHTSWRNRGFQAYADYMSSTPFRSALERVIEWSADRPLALMCAEAAPGRCHRQLIADALVARGLRVVHILGPGHVDRHVLNADARLADGGSGLVYDGGAGDQLSIW